MLDVGETDWEPEVGFVPVHPLDAVQEVVSVEDQFNVDDCPDVIDVGLADKDTVGSWVPDGVVVMADAVLE